MVDHNNHMSSLLIKDKLTNHLSNMMAISLIFELSLASFRPQNVRKLQNVRNWVVFIIVPMPFSKVLFSHRLYCLLQVVKHRLGSK